MCAKLNDEHYQVPDEQDLRAVYQGSLPAQAIVGLEQFNRGEYFDAHETLEEVWREETTAAREVYRAILQVGVAYLQIERGNYRGAIKMFLRARKWLQPLPEICMGVDIADLRKNADHVFEVLRAGGPEKIHTIDPIIFKPVRFQWNTSI